MKNLNLVFVFYLVVLAIACVSGSSLFSAFKIKIKLENPSSSGCQKIVQSAKYADCGLSQEKCRVCCHFDFQQLNIRFGTGYFYIEQVQHVKYSDQCVCDICKKYNEDFNNPAWF
jgi:hypothetical protein